jgi:hypothetical protein
MTRDEFVTLVDYGAPHWVAQRTALLAAFDAQAAEVEVLRTALLALALLVSRGTVEETLREKLKLKASR